MRGKLLRLRITLECAHSNSTNRSKWVTFEGDALYPLERNPDTGALYVDLTKLPQVPADPANPGTPHAVACKPARACSSAVPAAGVP